MHKNVIFFSEWKCTDTGFDSDTRSREEAEIGPLNVREQFIERIVEHSFQKSENRPQLWVVSTGESHWEDNHWEFRNVRLFSSCIAPSFQEAQRPGSKTSHLLIPPALSCYDHVYRMFQLASVAM